METTKRSRGKKEKTPSGPKPKPEQSKAVRPPAPRKRTVLKQPEYLDDYAKQEWNTYAPELKGVLTPSDVPAFAQLCMCLATVRRCAEIMNAKADKTKIPIQELKVMGQAQDRAFKLLDRLGMTPGSRRKITGKPQQGHANGGTKKQQQSIAQARRVRLFGVPD